MIKINGSCLCGKVQYLISGQPIEITHCHCSLCRKAHGAAFVSFLRVYSKHLSFVSGEDALHYFSSSKHVKRGFCSYCGSQTIFHYDKMPEILWVSAGTLDDDPQVRARHHIFIESKACWFEITDDLPQHQEYPKKD